MRLSAVEKQAIVVALSEVLAGPGLQGYEDDPAEEARLLAAMWRAHEKLAEFGRTVDR